jgi:hypothetical protein
MVALDHNSDFAKGYEEARVHTLDHLRIVPQHCYVVENASENIVSVMVLHPQEEVFEIEDFHVEEIQRNREALILLRARLLEYLENVQTEVMCCPYALKRLMVV